MIRYAFHFRILCFAPIIPLSFLPRGSQNDLGSPNVHVIEVSSASDDASYREAHVPGAHWWFWKGALWHETDRAFAAPEALAEQLGRMGVGPDATIVLYGEPVQFGTYAYWVLKMAGFTNLKLLDGAKKKWIADGMPVSSEASGSQEPSLILRRVRRKS